MNDYTIKKESYTIHTLVNGYTSGQALRGLWPRSVIMSSLATHEYTGYWKSPLKPAKLNLS